MRRTLRLDLGDEGPQRVDPLVEQRHQPGIHPERLLAQTIKDVLEGMADRNDGVVPHRSGHPLDRVCRPKKRVHATTLALLLQEEEFAVHHVQVFPALVEKELPVLREIHYSAARTFWATSTTLAGLNGFTMKSRAPASRASMISDS